MNLIIIHFFSEGRPIAPIKKILPTPLYSSVCHLNVTMKHSMEDYHSLSYHRLVYNPATNEYSNTPGVDIHVPGFGDTATVATTATDGSTAGTFPYMNQLSQLLCQSRICIWYYNTCCSI